MINNKVIINDAIKYNSIEVMQLIQAACENNFETRINKAIKKLEYMKELYTELKK